MTETSNPKELVAVEKQENNNTNKAEAIEEAEAGGKDQGEDQNKSNMEKPNRRKLLAALATILTFIFHLPILASVVWLFYMKNFDCENLLRLPKLQSGIGIGLIAVFVISNGIVFLRAKFPMAGLMVVMVPLLVMLTMGLALVGAYNLESRTIVGSPVWLKSKIYDNDIWNTLENCLLDHHACTDYISRSSMLKSYSIPSTKLSYIEYGCCRPPAICGMGYVNATYWEKRSGNGDGSYRQYDSDCDLWENNENGMCYNCNSCKRGFYLTLKSKWWRLGVFLVFMASLLIVSHLFLFISTMLEHHLHF